MPHVILSLILAVGLAGPLAAVADKQQTDSGLLSKTRQLTFEGRRSGEGYFSADGSLMVFQSERDANNPYYQIHLMDLETGDVERLSSGIGKTTCAWVHPSNERVLYASTHEDPAARDKMHDELAFRASGKSRRYSWDYDAEYEIYAHERSTGQSVNLTHARGYDAEGAYSPDGQQIVFASNRRAYDGSMTAEETRLFEHDKSYMMDIYLMNADGSGLRRLTDSPGYDGGPFFSADGQYITWRRFAPNGATAEIYSMDLASGKERQLTRMGHMSWAPYFHPSGDYLIFASNREGFANFELYLVDAQGQREPVRVTHTDGFDGLPVFSPDGGQLSWTSNRGAAKQSQIYLADWDDARARELLKLGAPGADAQPAAAGLPSGLESAIRSADARAHVERLAAVNMQGRLTGSEGERRAAEYVAAMFRQLGLQPAGDEGGYIQAFPFTAGVRLGGANQLLLRLQEAEQSPVLNRDWRPLAFSRNGNSGEAGVVFAGYGIVAPGAGGVPAYDSYADLDVTGKWVMALRFQPESVPADWRRHLVHYSDLAYKASVARRRGALGLMVVTGPEAKARERLVALKFEASAGASSLAAVSLSDDLARRLMAAANRNLSEVQQALDKGEAVAGFALPGLGVAALIDVEQQTHVGHNVLARLPAEGGASAPLVMLGAHLDHLGHGEGSGSLATEPERGQVHPGADDNASGVAGMLEVAQYLVDQNRRGRLKPRRDILFAAWSGEELGTLGSSHFVERHKQNGALSEQVGAYLNMDMIGHLRERVYLQGAGSSGLWKREIERRNVPVGLAVAIQSDPYLPTDTTPFYMQGVPVLNAFTGAHEDYSTPRDVPAALDYEGVRDVARLMGGILRSLARSEGLPDYQKVERKKAGLSRKHLRAYLGTIPAYGQGDQVVGVKLQGAVKGGPAEAAGVVEGDILVGLAGVEVQNIHDFMGALAGLKAGQETDLAVTRDGKRVELRVTPAARE